MRKTRLYALGITMVAFAVYSLMVFLLKEDRTTAFWIAYLCTLVAEILAEAVAFVSGANKEKRIQFLNLPLYHYCGVFAVVSLVAGLILALLVSNVKAVVFVEGVLYAGFLIPVLITMQGKLMVEYVEAEIRESTEFVTKLRLEANILYERGKGTACENKLKELAEAIRYSDPVSSPATRKAELEILESFWILEKKLEEKPGEIVEETDKVLQLLRERNTICVVTKSQ